MMLSKISNILSDMKDCEYFLRFTTHMRTAETKQILQKLKSQRKQVELLADMNSHNEPQPELSTVEMKKMLDNKDPKEKVAIIIRIWKQNHVYGTVKKVSYSNILKLDHRLNLNLCLYSKRIRRNYRSRKPKKDQKLVKQVRVSVTRSKRLWKQTTARLGPS